MALAWSLPTGFDTPITYFYVMYFAVLLIHRQRRDDENCEKKWVACFALLPGNTKLFTHRYGADWEKYKKMVPSRIIPYVYWSIAHCWYESALFWYNLIIFVVHVRFFLRTIISQIWNCGVAHALRNSARLFVWLISSLVFSNLSCSSKESPLSPSPFLSLSLLDNGVSRTTYCFDPHEIRDNQVSSSGPAWKGCCYEAARFAYPFSPFASRTL